MISIYSPPEFTDFPTPAEVEMLREKKQAYSLQKQGEILKDRIIFALAKCQLPAKVYLWYQDEGDQATFNPLVVKTAINRLQARGWKCRIVGEPKDIEYFLEISRP
jgi:hypothetical protein